MEWVRRLDELGKDDVALAGGKGASLGEMARAGLPVPPGFVLLTSGYRAFVAAHGLQAEIERLAAAARPDDPAAVEAAAAAIRALFDGRPVPEAVAAAVTAAYAGLGGGPVAVRSSATAEDLPGASFAGQQESYLNVDGPEQVLAAVRRCWSSLWTARAISYRARQGIAPAAVALAVVVQRLVAAEAAGVLFTVNPVNGRRDQVVIDAAWGLGEAVVSGQVTPDHWVADARTGAVLEQRVGCKEVMTARAGVGTVTLPVPAELREKPVLDAGQVAALAALGRRVAAHYGVPQDIEWAVAEGRIYLLQARPITSLFPMPEPVRSEETGLRVYISANSMQGIVEPITPMGLAAFRRVGRGLAGVLGLRLAPGQDPPAFKVAAGRVYLDVTGLLRHRLGRKMIIRMTGLIDRPLSAAVQALAERDARLSAVRGGLPALPAAGFLLRVARGALAACLWPDAARRRRLASVERAVQALEQRAAGVQGVAARRRCAEEVLERLFPTVIPRLAPLVAAGLLARLAAEACLRRWLGDAAALQPVLRSLPHNPTTEMDLALWRLSRTLKAQGLAPAADHPGVQAFLAAYGHRAVREIDLGMPRWREDPAHVLNVLETYLTHREAEDPERHFRQGAAAAGQAAAALVARVRREQGALRAALLRFLLSRLRALGGLREYPKFYAVRLLALARHLLAGAGAELAAAGRLDQAGDLFFLDLDDLDRAADLRATAAVNRAAYQRELERRAVPRLITSEGETFYSAPVSAAGALSGTAASPGVHSGRARVIRDPRGARLEPGEVLVAPGTDPAWTPLFLTAGALVMEIGGIMSHGSVVAREYGIPAVVGVAGATRRLRTGQWVRVDGEAGLVVPLEEPDGTEP